MHAPASPPCSTTSLSKAHSSASTSYLSARVLCQILHDYSLKVKHDTVRTKWNELEETFVVAYAEARRSGEEESCKEERRSEVGQRMRQLLDEDHPEGGAVKVWRVKSSRLFQPNDAIADRSIRWQELIQEAKVNLAARQKAKREKEHEAASLAKRDRREVQLTRAGAGPGSHPAHVTTRQARRYCSPPNA